MVLTVVLVAVLGCAVVLVVRWRVVGVDGLGRPAPFPRISVALCLLAAVACAVPLLLHARLEARLTTAAAVVADRPVRVHCQTFGETWTDAGAELGHVRYLPGGMPERKALLAYDVCRDLRAWLRSDRAAPTRDQIVAVHVLTHETMHMRGITIESWAECAAVQRDAWTARLLGATPAQAQELARRYWLEVYPRMPDGYRDGCGAGATYDEGLPDAPWNPGP